MNDTQFWATVEIAWAESLELRERIRRHERIDLAALSHVIFALGDALAAMTEQDGITFIATWRPRAYGLVATGRVPTLELACFIVAVGHAVYDEAMQGLWKDEDDPSEGAFAAMLGSFEDEDSPVSPLARPSRPSSALESDTPAPSAVRVRGQDPQ